MRSTHLPTLVNTKYKASHYIKQNSEQTRSSELSAGGSSLPFFTWTLVYLPLDLSSAPHSLHPHQYRPPRHRLRAPRGLEWWILSLRGRRGRRPAGGTWTSCSVESPPPCRRGLGNPWRPLSGAPSCSTVIIHMKIRYQNQNTQRIFKAFTLNIKFNSQMIKDFLYFYTVKMRLVIFHRDKINSLCRYKSLIQWIKS